MSLICQIHIQIGDSDGFMEATGPSRSVEEGQ